MHQSQQPAQRGASGTGHGPTTQSGRRFQTASYLSADVRESMIQRLNRTLADATVLQTQAKFAHWNVKGMAFYGLHELFDDLAAALTGAIDLIAERITALGGQAMGTAGQAADGCRLPPMPTDAVTGPEYVDVMTERLAVFDANLYRDIQTANDRDDLDTADLLNEVSRDVSTYLWFVEAHHQTEPIRTAGGPGQSAASLQQAAYGPGPETTAPGQQPQGSQATGQPPAVSSQPPAARRQSSGASQQTGQGTTPTTWSESTLPPESGTGEGSSGERTDQLVAAGMQ